MMKPVVSLILLCVFAAACLPLQVTPTFTPSPEPSTSVNTETPSLPPAPNPYAPQPGDDKLMRGTAFMTSADLMSMESFPEQIEVVVSGNLPTPCHTFRAIVHKPDSLNNINVEIYALTDPGVLCDQVLYSFEAKIPLGLYPPGHYTVLVNGEPIGDFNS